MRFDSYSLSGRTLCGGRFEVVRRLGEGGAGVVYETHDRARGERVALKTLARMSPVNVYRLKQEFRSLADVVHPHLIGLHELFREDDLWFFTMDLVRGTDFISYVRPEWHAGVGEGGASGGREELSVQRLRDGMRQLAAGVCAIHRAGKLHRDLKPSNILVSEDGHVSILDFGLAIEADAQSPKRTRETGLFGTPHYLAPERLEGGPSSEAADWYAVGVALHEALLGELPFAHDRGSSSRDLAAVPVPPHERARELPRDLSELCVRLLHPEPAARPSGDEVLTAVGGPHPLRREVGRPAVQPLKRLVGREHELTALHQALRRAERGTPVVVTLPGLSGMGKSALMAAFAAQARAAAHAVILAGRCYERESVPYKTLDSVIDQLARFWRRLPVMEAAALLPRDAFSLMRVFPVLSRVEAVARAPQRDRVVRDPHELRRRAFRALRELFGRLGDRYTLVLIIDDLQWGDRESARELLRLLAPPDPPALLALCAYRDEEVARDSALDGLLGSLADSRVQHMEVPVGPLSAEAASELVGDLAPDERDARVVWDIVRESEGSPFFVGELVRQRGRAARGEPLRLAEVVRKRLSELGDAERKLLDLLVAAPGPVKQDVLREASGLGKDFNGALKSLLAQSLVRTRGGRAYDLVEPFHDRIREAVVQELSEQVRVRCHAAFAQTWGRRSDAEPEALAAHLEGCDRTEEAAPHYERAAELARAALAFDHAAMLYRRALEVGAYDSRTRASLLSNMAEVLACAGRGPESAAAYRAAADCAPAARRNELLLRAAEQWLYAGHSQPALKLLKDILPALGLRLPTRRWQLIPQLMIDGIKLARRPPARLLASPVQDREAASRAELCATLGDAILYVDFGLFVYFQQRHVLHGLASGEPGRVAEALTTRALLTASPAPHKFDSVLEDLELARELTQGVRDPLIRGRVTINRAIVFSAAGRYVETQELAQRAEHIFRNECQGVKWGLQLALLWQSVALFYLGRFTELAQLCREYLPDARARGDRMLTKLLSVWTAWSELAGGDSERAFSASPEVAMDAFTVLDGGVVAQRACLFLHVGARERAWDLFQQADPHVKRSGMLRARTRAYEYHWTRGLAAAHLLQDGAVPVARCSLDRDMRELAGSRTSEALAMAEHLRGAKRALDGDAQRAAQHWHAAADGYEKRGMAAFAQTVRLAAELALGRGDGSVALEAKAGLSSCGVREIPAWLSLWCPGWRRG